MSEQLGTQTTVDPVAAEDELRYWRRLCVIGTFAIIIPMVAVPFVMRAITGDWGSGLRWWLMLSVLPGVFFRVWVGRRLSQCKCPHCGGPFFNRHQAGEDRRVDRTRCFSCGEQVSF